MPIRLRKCAVTGSTVSAANTVFKSSICTASSNHVGTASRKQELHKLPQFRMSVGPRRKSAFLLSYLTHCFPLFCTVFFLPGCPCSSGLLSRFFPVFLCSVGLLSHPSTTTRQPAQSPAPETTPLLKSLESPPQMWQVLCWSDSQIPGVTLFSRPVPHTFWYTYGIRTAFFRSARCSARRASYGCRRH